MLKINQRGETIVEVLICIAVLSLGFGSAFLLSNHAAKTASSNGYYYQAQLYANQQITLLHVYATGNSDFRSQSFFSMNQDGTLSTSAQTIYPITTGGINYVVKIKNTQPGLSRSYNIFDINVSWKVGSSGSVMGSLDIYYGT
jgi:hypothetical protein